MIDFVTWPTLYNNDTTKKVAKWQSQSYIVVKICYNLLYVIQVFKRFLISDFLTSTDIKAFCRTYLYTMMLLIDLAFFYTQDVFV